MNVAAPAIVTRTPEANRLRPVPADFAERCASGMSIAALCEHYGVGTFVVNRWIAEIGGKQRAKRVLPPRPAPDDFAQFAQVETVDQLLRRYKVGTQTIARWRRESGLAVVRALPVPADLASMAARLPACKLEHHYGVSAITVRKWCRQSGIRPIPAPRGTMPNLGAMGRPKAAPFSQNVDTSRAGRAADYLRRFGPVVRCKANGIFDPKGDHWRRGSTILCADEVIARAIRNGWNPDAWKDLAA